MYFNFKGEELYIHPILVDKLDIIAERITKHKFDCLLLLDGGEGYGKSNLAATCCAYISYKTGRGLENKNVFFQVDDMLEFATKTKEQIIWWDEAALGGLASESYNKIQTKLLKLLYVARKKQHFYVFCIPKFYKLKEPIVDRAVGLVHVYSKDEITRGRFAYYRRKDKDKLYLYWKTKKQQGYNKFYTKLGTFSESLGKVIDEYRYDLAKDKAILSIADGGNEAVSKKQQKNEEEKIKLYRFLYNNPAIDKKELAKLFEVSERTIRRRIFNARGAIMGGNDTDSGQAYNNKDVNTQENKNAVSPELTNI